MVLRAGLRIMGEGIEPARKSTPPPPEDDADEEVLANPVVLTPEARAMIYAPGPPRPELPRAEAPLRGSVRDRMRRTAG